MLDRGEHARQADGQDEHADHLHHGDDAENPVIGVVGRGEPGEVDPGPADGEARKAEADQRSGVVAFRQRMGELGGREPEADHERQVEQQFERRRDAMGLVGIASTHAPGVMVERSGASRVRGHDDLSLAIMAAIPRARMRLPSGQDIQASASQILDQNPPLGHDGDGPAELE